MYLYIGQFLSKQRTAQALSELFGTPVSQGTVSAMTDPAADGLDEFLDVVHNRIADAEVAGFDETGFRVEGKLHWVLCGRNGSDDAGVLPRFTGVAVHDAWAPYDTCIDPAYQLCCAHALRELAAVADPTPEGSGGQPRPATRWSRSSNRPHRPQRPASTPSPRTRSPNRYDCSARPRRSQSPKPLRAPPRRCRSTTPSPADCRDRHHYYLRFTTDLRIPPDNNGTERYIRMIKLRQKISGCMRTLTGAKQFCTIRSHLSTAAKHGHNHSDTLVTLAEGQPWLPKQPDQLLARSVGDVNPTARRNTARPRLFTVGRVGP